MKIDGTTIRNDTVYLVINTGRDDDDNEWKPAGFLISQHRTFRAADRSRRKTSGYGIIIDVRDVDYYVHPCFIEY